MSRNEDKNIECGMGKPGLPSDRCLLHHMTTFEALSTLVHFGRGVRFDIDVVELGVGVSETNCLVRFELVLEAVLVEWGATVYFGSSRRLASCSRLYDLCMTVDIVLIALGRFQWLIEYRRVRFGLSV